MPINPVETQSPSSTQDQTPQPSPAAQPAVVDSAAIAAAVVSGMAQAGAFARPQIQEPTVDPFEKLLADLKANPESDAGTISSIEAMIRAAMTSQESKITAKQAEVMRAQTAEVVKQTALNTIYLAMDDEMKNHPGVMEYKEDIVNRVCTKFSTDPAYKDAFTKYQNGIIDPVVLRSLCQSETEKFLNIRVGGVSTRGPAGGARQETTQADGDGAFGDVDAQIKQLVGADAEIFNSMLTLQQKSGHNRHSKEAKAEALRLTRLRNKKRQ